MRHAVIMAGGSGTRLWPLSRRARPKQFMRLFDGASLLQLARRRIERLFGPHNTWVVTSASYVDLVARELPDVPRENLIGEPVPRDTAHAIGLAAHLLRRRDPGAVMAVFTADHLIEPQEAFEGAIGTGLEAAEAFPESLVTFGIRPDRPHTGYGYLRRGAPLRPQVYRVLEFREKPDAATAEAYLKSGEYCWNSGMFVWTVQAILAALRRHLPDSDAVLEELARDWPGSGRDPAAVRRFGELRRISIDYGVLERADNVLLVEMPCRWTDLGSFSALAATRQADPAGNVTIAPQVLLAGSAAGNIVVAEEPHLIALLGVSDLIVVHSPDATLVCRADREQELRDLVEQCRQRFGQRYE